MHPAVVIMKTDYTLDHTGRHGSSQAASMSAEFLHCKYGPATLWQAYIYSCENIRRTGT